MSKMNHSTKIAHLRESSSNPQSRLKTRKVLGVGEIPSEGYIYRSKLSQLLGCRTPIEARLPKGMQFCCTITFAYLFCFGVLHLFFSTEELEQSSTFQNERPHPIAISWTSESLKTGVTIMVLALQYRAMITSIEDVAIQKGLFFCCCFMFIQCCVSTYELKQSAKRTLLAECALLLKYTCLISNLIYYQIIQPNSILNKMHRRPMVQKSDEDQSNTCDLAAMSTSNINKEE
ncbi:hypothetical protein M513_13125, partial [Trichuris suis]